MSFRGEFTNPASRSKHWIYEDQICIIEAQEISLVSSSHGLSVSSSNNQIQKEKSVNEGMFMYKGKVW
jgi:hypothetical protein